MDISSLINNFLGSNQESNSSQGSSSASVLAEKAKEIAKKATSGGVNSFAGGAAAGGLLTLLLSNSNARSIAGSALTYGGVALVGALAHKAYQNYTANKNSQNTNAVPQLTSQEPVLDSGDPFAIVLMKGMIAAAKSDGHIDSQEQTRIFSKIEQMNLPSDQKSLILDCIMKPINRVDLISSVRNEEQAAQLYLASCMAIDIDHPEEQKYLKDLSNELKLPQELVNSLHKELGRI